MKRGSILLAIFVSITLIALVSASFNYVSEDIKTSYDGGEKISGKINISFEGEESYQNLTSNYDGGINLLEFLQLNDFSQGDDFNCTTAGCGKDYRSKLETDGLTFSSEGSKKIGFRMEGNDFEEVSEIRFDVSSNVANSCASQIEINLLGEEESISYTNDNYIDEKCGNEIYGCFDLESGGYSKAIIGNNILCEKLSLPAAPAYRVGARIFNSSNGQSQLKVQLYNLDGEFIAESNLPSLEQSSQKISAIINYSSSSAGEYLACVTGESGNDYKINRESAGISCGTNDLGDEYDRDYEIFAYPLKFGPVDFSISENEDSIIFDNSILDHYNEYVSDHYNSMCEPECILPIEIKAVSQEVTLSNILLRYREGGDLLQNNKLYSLEESDGEIDSEELEVELIHANITVPNDEGNSTFKLYIGDEKVFEKKISISESFDFDVNPKFILIGQETEIFANSAKNITSSSWKFEDKTINSDDKSVLYTATSSGTISLEVTLESSLGQTSKRSFEIISGDAKESANLTIAEYERRLSNITGFYNSLGSWIKTELEKEFNPSEKSAQLSNIKDDFELATSDEEYVVIVNSLLSLNIPQSVAISEKGIVPIESGLGSIDGSLLEEISLDGSGGSSGEIEAWMLSNYRADVSYNKYASSFSNKENVLATEFNYKFEKLSDFSDETYLVIDYPIEGMKFKEDYGQRALNGGTSTYVPVSGEDIGVILTEEISVEDLRSFISPDSKFLPVVDEDIREEEPDRTEFKYGRFIIGILILLIVFFVVYIIVQEWYKRNYERYLFKNQDSLYNVLSFIYNSRKSGLMDREIRTKLRKNKWNSEQINYAFRKIDGKRTGMFEIPIFKMFEKKKVAREIGKRQPNGMVDTRFIKPTRM